MNTNLIGEFWNTDAKTPEITRLLFSKRAGRSYVSAWGACFPTDCEWGETDLHLLDDASDSTGKVHAFATWELEGLSHCLLTLDREELTVLSISIRSEFNSKTHSSFRKDAIRSAKARNPDPLEKFSRMWDGSERGWKLVQYKHPVYLVEINFKQKGPTRREFPAVLEWFGSLPNETKEQMWQRSRGCSGISISNPFNPTKMKRLKRLQREYGLDLTVYTIEPGDYLVLTPMGNHYDWVCFPKYRRPVVDRMLKAGVEVVAGKPNSRAI